MDRKGSGTAVKTGERKENMGAWLRRLGRAMKDDRGGYAMITVLIICGMVVGMFVWATLTIVEQSYTAQERQFARQTELLQAQGDLEAACAEIKSMAPVEIGDFTKDSIEAKISPIVDVKDVEAISPASVNAEDSTQGTATQCIVVEAVQGESKVTAKIQLDLACEMESGSIKAITGIETGYVSYEEVQG